MVAYPQTINQVIAGDWFWWGSPTNQRRLLPLQKLNMTTTSSTERTELIPPYGGRLVDLLIPAEDVPEKLRYANRLKAIRLNQRTICDLELLAIGAFSPLDRFMGQADLQSVLDNMRLQSGYLSPIPIVLPINDEDGVEIGMEIALRNENNHALAVMKVEEKYSWDLDEIAVKVFGKNDLRHPLVAEMHQWGKHFVSGQLEVIQLPPHYDFKGERLTPQQTRAQLEELHQTNIVAFQTRNPLHRVHEELTKRAAESIDGALLLHPVVGMTKPGDVDHYTRVRTYKALARSYYDPQRIILSLLPLAMRMAGPREALWHAIIRRNYGANHLIVGRDHAGPGKDSHGEPFYGPYDAQDLVQEHAEELGVKPIPFRMLVYLPDEDRYEEIDKVPEHVSTASISGTQVREEYLAKGNRLPDWFTRPEVAEILVESYPPQHQRGACIWLTGLSGSGKSSVANVLTSMIMENGRQVTLLDGDVVRTHFSSELGFSESDRNANVLRMGFVASEIVRHGGVVICAAVSPYRATRNQVRSLMGKEGYIEVFVDAPLEVCEARDTKGLYAKARRGEISGLTGIDAPYEAPRHPELRLESAYNSAELNAQVILNYLIGRGLIRAAGE